MFGETYRSHWDMHPHVLKLNDWKCQYPRAKSNRNGGRNDLGIPGEIISVRPGEFIGICTSSMHTTTAGASRPSKA